MFGMADMLSISDKPDIVICQSRLIPSRSAQLTRTQIQRHPYAVPVGPSARSDF
ncbi:hypothetical protein JMJ77_0008169 [Colletotrichum scovillei]|uniref:Uncharacterized protein n=1 Tax=Colletotrichum scovillei TaxID=1209932 RepID=A0A9P7UJG8_9PEZI|nr:hypothetical protein JMJ77_0008169 [Colletotrichum scovillei]KAG7075161.1 hypothetical protein JMJ76_0011623 [Colletotrichum scovillei]KAG7082131.1 hypothetical protein JMJ78_0004236 [Colletotrichum scovillei]